ncbi:hypothetical protein HKX48_002861 [Thoreauomyces humboldtii]|nr:hypothetical protein HKX48_002861 [Thoreauomyces humboldtii]
MHESDSHATEIRSPRIYIYDLPPEYNVQPLEIVRPMRIHAGDMGSEYGGLGPVLVEPGLRETNQFSLEVIAHERLAVSDLGTLDPSEADLFYVPFYAGVELMRSNSLPTIEERSSVSLQVWDYLAKQPFWNGGNNHFMALGRIEMDFLQTDGTYGTSFLLHPAAANVTFFSIEPVSDRSGIHHHTIPVPYPAHTHASQNSLPEVDYDAKNLLISSNWLSRTPLRRTLRSQCDSHPDLCTHYEEHDWQAFNNTLIADLNLRSTFCLQPGGDSPTRSAFWDSLLMGCIPVVFPTECPYPHEAYPFSDRVPWNRTIVSLDSDLDVVERLAALTEEEVMGYQEEIEERRWMWQYSDTPEDDDAFSVLLEEIVERWRGTAGW